MQLLPTHFLKKDFHVLLEMLARSFVAVLLILSIIFPIARAFLYPKAVISVLILIIVLVLLARGRLLFCLPWYLVAMAYALIGLLWSFFGIVLDNPGAVSVMFVMVAYPLIFALFAPLYRRTDDSLFTNIFIVCSWLIGILDLLFIFGSSTSIGSWLANFFMTLYPDWAVVDWNDYYLKFTLPNVASLIFLLPFLLSALFRSTSLKATVRFVPLMLILTAIGIVSARRGLFVSMLAGPMLAYFLTRKYSFSGRQGSLLFKLTLFPIVPAVFLILIYASHSFAGTQYYIEQIRSITDFTNNESNLARYHQFSSLLQGIADKPMLGAGAGAPSDFLRSEGKTWATNELFYLAFVFHYGLIGSMIYAAGMASLIVYLVVSVRKCRESSFDLCFLSGMLGFLIANATNPYLDTIDYMWIIFIPYAKINLHMTEMQRCGGHKRPESNE